MLRKIYNIFSIALAVLSIFTFDIIHNIYRIYIPFLIIIFMLIIGILIIAFFGLFIDKNKEYEDINPYYHLTYSLVIEGLIKLFGGKIHYSGLEKVPTDHRYLLVFNHTSIFDPMLINVLLKNEPIIHISKPENFKIPIGGPYMIRECNLSFKRNDMKNNAKIILKAAQYLKDDKFSIGLAPEGTRNKGDVSKLLPFHEGVFKIPLKSERDIVIVEIRNTEKLVKNFPFKKTDIEMNVLDVIKFDQYKDMSSFEISNLVQNMIQNKIDKRL